MKKTIYSFAILSLLVIISCGPSAEEKVAIEKAKMDSIANATKQKMETKLALQDSLKWTRSNKGMMEMQLTETKGELAAAKDRMGLIKEFQLGRTQSERGQQIKNQTILIDSLEKQIRNLEITIQATEQKIRNVETELKNYE